MIFAGVLGIVGALAIGAWLVITGHPFFGLLVILIGASITVTFKKQE